MHVFIKRLFFSSFFLFGFFSEARIFRSNYVSFQLPDNWSCKKDLATYVCQNKTDKNKKKEAVIIILAKEAGKEDGIKQYIERLKNPMKNNSIQKISTVESFTDKKILKGHRWVDSLHYQGALPQHYTRYLVTVKQQLAILISFTAHKDYFVKYSEDFKKAINSLKLIAPKNYLQLAQLRKGKNKGSIIGNISNKDFFSTVKNPKVAKKNHLGLLAILFFIFFPLIFWFIFLRKKKRKI